MASNCVALYLKSISHIEFLIEILIFGKLQPLKFWHSALKKKRKEMIVLVLKYFPITFSQLNNILINHLIFAVLIKGMSNQCSLSK